MVSAGETTFTVADVPGLIPGAAQGKGLGLDFLRHVERCAVLLHVLDCATLEPGRDPVSDLEAIEAELAQYESSLGDLLDRPRLVALNKVDVPEARELADFVTEELTGRGYRVFEISAVSHAGLRELTFALAGLVEQFRAEPGRDRAGPDRADPEGCRRLRVHRRSLIRRSPGHSSCGAASPSAGSARPSSTTTRRSGTWPTGWPGSVSRTSWPGWARCRAPP